MLWQVGFWGGKAFFEDRSTWTSTFENSGGDWKINNYYAISLDHSYYNGGYNPAELHAWGPAAYSALVVLKSF